MESWNHGGQIIVAFLESFTRAPLVRYHTILIVATPFSGKGRKHYCHTPMTTIEEARHLYHDDDRIHAMMLRRFGVDHLDLAMVKRPSSLLRGVGKCEDGVEEEDNSSKTMTAAAVLLEEQRVVESVTRSDINAGVLFTTSSAPLHRAVADLELHSVRWLLGWSNVDVNSHFQLDWYPYTYAATPLGQLNALCRNEPHEPALDGIRRVIALVLLQAGANINEEGLDEEGPTPLMRACFEEDLEMVRTLVTVGGADPKIADGNGETALHEACGYSCLHQSDMHTLEIVKLLLDSPLGGPGLLNVISNYGQNALHVACEFGDQALVSELVGRGVNTFVGDNNGEFLINRADYSRKHSREIKEFLWNDYIERLQNGQDQTAILTFLQEVSFTPGSSIFDSGKLSTGMGKVFFDEALPFLHMLIPRESETALLTRDPTNGELRVRLACRAHAMTQIIRCLCNEENETDNDPLDTDQLCILDRWAHLPIHSACRSGSPLGTLRFLVENAGVWTLQIPDVNFALPLHHLVASPAALLNSVEYIVEQNVAALQSKDQQGRLPVHVACGSGCSLETIRHLVEQGGVETLRVRDHQGFLPFHHLCGAAGAPFDAVEYLLEVHPDSVRVTTGGGSLGLPMMIAAESNNSVSVLYKLVSANPSFFEPSR